MNATLESEMECDLVVPYQGHIFQEKADHPFALPARCGRVTPETRKIGGHGEECAPLLCAQLVTICLAPVFIFLLRLGQRAQFVVPIGFEGIGHQPVVRIDAEVTVLSEFGLVSCSLDVCPAQSVRFLQTGLQFLLDGEGDLKGNRAHGLDQHLANCPVDCRSRYPLADGGGMFDAGDLAAIFRAEQSSLGVITDGHSIPADAANHQTLKKCGPFSRWTFASVRSPTLGALAESSLVLLTLGLFNEYRVSYC